MSSPSDEYPLEGERAGEYPLAGEGAGTGPRTCPSCHEPLAEKAVLCVNCGHDTRTGRRLVTRRRFVGVGDDRTDRSARTSPVGPTCRYLSLSLQRSSQGDLWSIGPTIRSFLPIPIVMVVPVIALGLLLGAVVWAWSATVSVEADAPPTWVVHLPVTLPLLLFLIGAILLAVREEIYGTDAIGRAVAQVRHCHLFGLIKGRAVLCSVEDVCLDFEYRFSTTGKRGGRVNHYYHYWSYVDLRTETQRLTIWYPRSKDRRASSIRESGPGPTLRLAYRIGSATGVSPVWVGSDPPKDVIGEEQAVRRRQPKKRRAALGENATPEAREKALERAHEGIVKGRRILSAFETIFWILGSVSLGAMAAVYFGLVPISASDRDLGLVLCQAGSLLLLTIASFFYLQHKGRSAWHVLAAWVFTPFVLPLLRDQKRKTLREIEALLPTSGPTLRSQANTWRGFVGRSLLSLAQTCTFASAMVLLAYYPLSYGPARALDATGYLSDGVLSSTYGPLIQVAEQWEGLARFLDRWADYCVREARAAKALGDERDAASPPPQVRPEEPEPPEPPGADSQPESEEGKKDEGESRPESGESQKTQSHPSPEEVTGSESG